MKCRRKDILMYLSKIGRVRPIEEKKIRYIQYSGKDIILNQYHNISSISLRCSDCLSVESNVGRVMLFRRCRLWKFGPIPPCITKIEFWTFVCIWAYAYCGWKTIHRQYIDTKSIELHNYRVWNCCLNLPRAQKGKYENTLFAAAHARWPPISPNFRLHSCYQMLGV